VARTRDRHAAVHGLLAAGNSEREAARVLGLSRGTVHRFAAAASAGELLGKATSRQTKPGRYKPFLRQRRNEGITSAVAPHAELQAKGWQGSVQAVERYVRPFRAMTAAPPPGPVIPATRQNTRWLLSRPATLKDDEQAQLAGVQDRCPHLNALAGHVRSFAEIMTRRQGQQELEARLTRVEAGDQPQLHSFANGIRRDQQAVTAGLTLPYSSAAVEGHVNRIILWNLNVRIHPRLAWRISVIGRRVAPWGIPISRGVAPDGVATSASRPRREFSAACPSSIAARSSSVRGMDTSMRCRFSLASSNCALDESFGV